MKRVIKCNRPQTAVGELKRLTTPGCIEWFLLQTRHGPAISHHNGKNCTLEQIPVPFHSYVTSAHSFRFKEKY